MLRERTGMRINTLTLNPSVDRILWVPGFAPGGHFAARRTLLIPAGKGVNVARYLKALGCEPTAWALVGRRELPLYREALVRAGIRARLYPVRGNTRQNITIVDPERGETHVREPGFQVAAREWEMLLKDLALATSAGDALVLSGSFPAGLGSRQLAGMLKALAGRQIFLDVNGVALPLEKAAATTRVSLKVNASEFAELSGRRATPEAYREFMAANPALERVVITAGAGEASWAGADGIVTARPPQVTAANAVGAGDAFMAGMLAGLAKGLNARECLRLAVAAGSASVVEPLVGDLEAGKVAELAGQVRIK